VKDLASRFADGRLSTEKLVAADDEELAQMLIEVRGIGRVRPVFTFFIPIFFDAETTSGLVWIFFHKYIDRTYISVVDMFAIFSLRRPDILPVGQLIVFRPLTSIKLTWINQKGDLGVQRGLLRWFLSLHFPAHPFSISPEKVSGQPGSPDKKGKVKSNEDKDALPVYEPDDGNTETDTLPLPDVSSVPPAPGMSTPKKKGKGKGKGSDLPSMPTPFTPSINKTLRGVENAPPAVPLPEGLSVGVLKGRLDSKKKIKWVQSMFFSYFFHDWL
jgi:DNA-3-methyladenine glycosylase II